MAIRTTQTSGSSMTATQLGALGENLVANGLILASDGRLSPFKPVADDGGIDLLIYDKISGRSVPIQVKSRTKRVGKGKTVHFEVREATFHEDGGAYLLAVMFTLESLEVQRAWLVPMAKLRKISMKHGGKFAIRPSLDLKSRDRYSAYRCKDLPEVASKLIDRLSSVSARQLPD